MGSAVRHGSGICSRARLEMPKSRFGVYIDVSVEVQPFLILHEG